MEKKRIFKPLTSSNTTQLSDTGKHLPIAKRNVELGLVEAGATGEGVRPIKSKKTTTNPRGSGRKPNNRDKSMYPNHKFIELYPKVFIVLKPDSNLAIADFTDFIQLAETSMDITDVVDILPPLYEEHYKIISRIDLRFMIGDEVIVNFKYRSLDPEKNMYEREPRTIKDVKFKCLNNMTVIIAVLDDDSFYPINELEHVISKEVDYDRD